MKIHITIPVLNQSDYLRECLKSIRETAPIDHHITVDIIDSGSSEKIKPIVIAEIPNETHLSYKFTRMDKNLGVTIPWNMGLKHGMEAGADVICISNSDVVYGPGVIHNCSIAIQNDIGACWPLSKQGGPMENDFFDKALEYSLRPADWVDTGGFAGWCFFLNPKIVQTVGYFDEKNFTLWYQDTDYHNRLHEHEIKHMEIRNCYLHHYESRTIVSLSDGFNHQGWREKDANNYFAKYPNQKR